MLQSPPHPRSPPLDSLQQLLIFLEEAMALSYPVDAKVSTKRYV